MAQIKPEWVEHQRRRWMRSDAARWLKPNWDARGRVRPAQPAEPAVTSAAIKAERDELLDLKVLVAEFKFHLALRAFGRKYRPDQPRDDRGRWVDDTAGSAGTASITDNSDTDDSTDDSESEDSADDDASSEDQREDDGSATDFSAARKLPRIPGEPPSQSSDRTTLAKEMAGWLRENADAVISSIVPVTSWLRDRIPNILSYLDEPKSLQELQEAASEPKSGYDIHHVVEKSSARADGYPESRIDAPENLVRIPRMRHWDINAWFQTSNENFDGMSPRDYLRYKDWDERERVGLDALRQHGVLRP